MSATYDFANGTNGVNGHSAVFPPPRFSTAYPSITVPVAEADGQIDVEISLDEDIQDDPTELCTLLENENTSKKVWMDVAIAYAKHKKLDVAIEVLGRADATMVGDYRRNDDRLSILEALCWLYLLKSREAPRTQLAGSDARTKENWIQSATGVLNDASRIDPQHPPLFLARGVLQLLRASLQAPATSSGPAHVSAERLDTLKQALKSFEDALRASHGKNLMAKLGKARANYSLGKYQEALKGYQSVMQESPGLIDPDPRIGIGACFWALGFKDDAATAWDRALELNPGSKIALVLLGVYYLHQSSQYATTDPKFGEEYKKAITQFALKAWKIDEQLPLACSTLGNFFFIRKNLDKAEKLAKTAIEQTDVNAVASDGWYLLARKAHQEEDWSKANEYYGKADQARGGDERGYIPAKFGAAQMRVQMQDLDGAKFRLEKITQQNPSVEAQTLLGALYAQEYFNPSSSKTKDERASDLRKALKHLEDVSRAWKDPKRKATPDTAVLLNLARLYEADHPEKSLKCLEEVEQIELDEIDENDYPEGIEDGPTLKAALRENLPPQLLNNMACFHYQADRYPQARDLFQTALNACVKARDKDESVDADALVTSISYNLARTYEAEGMLDDAKGVYEGLLKRHADYTDAQVRLAYISLRQHPSNEGPKAVTALFKAHPSDLEVRALFGWYLNKSKQKRIMDPAVDPEQKHYKVTLMENDKHDLYSLTGMGNLWLAFAREMKDSSEQGKQRRSKTYAKAVEFFEKALSLDSKNAYAAQGIAIALVEEKKDFGTALQIFTKVKETLKDHSVYTNLGHTYFELKQYSRAVENYELALAKDRARDPNLLACLGRVWLTRGRNEKSISALKTALDYSRRALELAPTSPHSRFNVAFVQFQIATLIHTLPETQRTLADLEAASKDLDEGIQSFADLAQDPNPPYPKPDLEQRGAMGRNTMRGQLTRAIEKQQAYEDANASKLQHAREQREAEIKAREEAKRKAEEAKEEEKRKIMEQRAKQQELDQQLLEKRREDDARRKEFVEEQELRKAERSSKRVKGGKRKKKGETDDDDESDLESDGAGGTPVRRARRRRTSASGTEGLSEEERPRVKKRKLERKGKPAAKNQGKYKSDEMIVDSDSEGEAAATPAPASELEGEAASSAPRGRKGRVVDDDDDEDEEGGEVQAPANGDDTVMDDEEDE